jgi:hypothetical protein
MLELYSMDTTMIRMPTKEVMDIINCCRSRKSNSSLEAMQNHTIYYGRALAPVAKEKASWDFCDFEPEYSFSS